MKRWIEHYSELYTRDWENGVWGSQRRHRVQTCCGGPGQWTNWRGSEKGPGFTSTWESAGEDSIRAEILKCCKGVAFTKLYQNSLPVLEGGEVPENTRDANIVTLYKNRGLEATATLSRHLTPQHRSKALCLSCSEASLSACRKILSVISLFIRLKCNTRFQACWYLSK